MANTLALVRFGGAQFSDVGGNLANELFVDTLDLDLVIALDGEGDSGDSGKGDRVGVAERKNEVAALEGDAVTGADQFEFLGIAMADANDGVLGERAAEAVKGTGDFILALAGNLQVTIFNGGGNLFGQSDAQVTLRAGKVELIGLNLNFDGIGQSDGASSNAAHRLPKLTNNFTTKVFGSGFFVGEQTGRGRNNGDTGTGKSGRNFGNTSVAADTGFADFLNMGQNRGTIRQIMEG